MPLRVKIQLGGNVFEAEGDAYDFVEDGFVVSAFDQWVSILNGLPAGATVKLDQILAQGQEFMMASAEVTAILNRIETAGTNIAADVRGLKDDVNIGMTAAEVAAVKAHAERIAVAMEALAAETPDVPPAPPTPPAA